MTGFLSDTPPVIHGSIALAGIDLTAIHNTPAQLSNSRNIGRTVGIELILIGDLIGRDHRGNDCEKDQEQQNIGCCHRGLVLGETQHSILEEAAELGVDLLVVQAGIHLHELEFLLRDMFKILIITHFFDPILIRGSIKP